MFADNFGDGFSVISDASNEIVATIIFPAGGSVGEVVYDSAKGDVVARELHVKHDFSGVRQQ